MEALPTISTCPELQTQDSISAFVLSSPFTTNMFTGWNTKDSWEAAFTAFFASCIIQQMNSNCRKISKFDFNPDSPIYHYDSF